MRLKYFRQNVSSLGFALACLFLISMAFQQPSATAMTRAITYQQSREQELAMALLAANEEERQKLLDTNPNLINPVLVKILNTKLSEMSSRGQLKQAIPVIPFAVALAERVGDKSELAGSYRVKAITLAMGGNLAQSLSEFRRSLKLAEEIADQPLIALLLSNLGIIHRRMGQLDEAAASYEKARRLAELLNDRKTLSDTLANYSVVKNEKGDYQGSLEMAREALKIYRELGNKQGMARALLHIGNVEEELGNRRESLRSFQQSLEISEELRHLPGIGEATGNIGIVYKEIGHYQQSLAMLQRALKIKEQEGDLLNVVNVLVNLASLSSLQGNLQQLEEYSLKALQLSKTAGLQRQAVTSLNQLAGLNINQKHYEQAMELSRQALEISQKMNMPLNIVESQQRIGQVYLSQNKIEEATKHFQQALQLAEQIKSNQQVTYLLTLLSTAYNSGKDYSQALVLAEKTLVMAEQIENSALQGEANNAHGDALAGLNQIEAARQSFLKAINKIEQLRNNLSGTEETRHLFLTKRLHPYHSLIKLLVEKRSPTAAAEAFEIAQRLNGRVLLDKMVNGPGNINVTTQSVTTAMTLAETTDLLDNQTALLNFAVTEQATYLFTVTKGVGLTVQTIPITRKELTEKVNRVRQRLANLDVGFRAPSIEVFRLLLAPVSEQLKKYKNLILIPDGPLWELPFQALISPTGKYLIEDYAVSYAPSLPTLRELAKGKNRNTTPSKTDNNLLLAFGNAAAANQSNQSNQSNRGLMANNTAALPEAENQAKALGAIYGLSRSKVYVGNEAREDRFLAEAGKYRILHIASHGLLNNANPLYSGLTLLPGGNADDDNDGLLEAYEIMKLKLNADLAVLSACETGRGQISEGEGMIGLSWALMLAGSQSTVVSLWKVESASTQALMLEFHRQVKANIERHGQVSPAQALQRAMLTVMKQPQYKHPAYWAGFTVIGHAN